MAYTSDATCPHGVTTGYICHICKVGDGPDIEEILSEVPEMIGGNNAPQTDDEIEEELVEKASRPSLATLFQLGKDKGLIKPTNSYGEHAP